LGGLVVGQTINPQFMEIHAEEIGRADVLETEGTLDVNSKKIILIQVHRLDSKLQALMVNSKSLTLDLL